MAQLAASVTGKRGDEDVMLAAQADTEAWYGRLKNSRELTRRAMDSAERNDARETAAAYQVAEALFEVTGQPRAGPRRCRCGDEAGAKPRGAGDRCGGIGPDRRYGISGETGGRLDKSSPLNIMIQRYWLPVIRAAVAMQRNDPTGQSNCCR